jgi:HlyD family secretion protein
MPRPDPSPDLAAIVRTGRSRPLRKSLIIAAIIALPAAGAWYYLTTGGEQGGAPEYVTEPASLGRISLVVTAAGNLAPTNQVIIGSELSGTIDAVHVDTNDTVKKDQPLALLDTSKLNQQTERSRAALLAAKARVSQAKATLEEARAALARQEELHTLSGGKTPSRATMETSRATVSRAGADLESADAAVAGAGAEVRAFERDLEKAIIRSPVDGVVLARSVEVGQTVAASFTAPTLFTIAEDLRKMELLVSVTEADIGRVSPGQTAAFKVDAWPTREYTATVKKVAFGSANNQNTGNGSNNNNNGNSGAASTGVVTYSAELEVANDDLSLRPGMTATVDIAIVDRKDILVVPNSALRFDPEYAASIGKPDDGKRTLVQSLAPGGGRRWRGTPGPKPKIEDSGPRVFIIRDGQPAEIPITPGITNGRITEITAGELQPGTPVIVSIKPPSAE